MKTKTANVTSTEKRAIERFLLFNEKMAPRRLSDFYQSRTTNYGKIFDSEIFVITDDKREIVKKGFNPLVKKIIFLDKTNPKVKSYLKKLAIEQTQAEELENEKIRTFKVEVLTAITFIKVNKLFIEERNPEILKENVSGMTLKPVAFWLSQKAKNVSSQAFLQALRNIYQ